MANSKNITTTSSPPSPTNPPQIYTVAQTAYSKLVTEASCKDQNLRRLVGHANLYDKLLDEYNNSFSDSESEPDVESYDEDAEEFVSLAFRTPNSVKGEARIVIHGEEEEVFHDEHLVETGNESKFGEIFVEEKENTGLCRVPKHGELVDDVTLHVVGTYTEVEVGETEIFDDD